MSRKSIEYILNGVNSCIFAGIYIAVKFYVVTLTHYPILFIGAEIFSFVSYIYLTIYHGDGDGVSFFHTTCHNQMRVFQNGRISKVKTTKPLFGTLEKK